MNTIEWLDILITLMVAWLALLTVFVGLLRSMVDAMHRLLSLLCDDHFALRKEMAPPAEKPADGENDGR